MIFLIGTQKSGTTWLRDCFAHVCTVPKHQELYFVELYERIAQHISIYGNMTDQQRIATTHKVVEVAWKTLLDGVCEGANFDKSAYPCTSTFMTVRNDLHTLAVKLAKNIFPTSYTVVIVRDPRSVLNSAIHYLNHFRPGWGNEIDAFEFGTNWQVQNERWLHDDPSIVVKYEDLKNDF